MVPHDGGWGVRAAGSDRLSRQFDLKVDAVNWARNMARQQQSELFIHGRDGRIQDRDSYGNDPCPPRDRKH